MTPQDKNESEAAFRAEDTEDAARIAASLERQKEFGIESPISPKIPLAQARGILAADEAGPKRLAWFMWFSRDQKDCVVFTLRSPGEPFVPLED